ncbi:MAG: DUF4157 domain-containing protein [Kofleriaceae bacterium]
MNREKSLREDHALDQRASRAPRAASEIDLDQLTTKPSQLWRSMPAPGSGQEADLARAGTRDGARELPYRAELEEQLGTDLSHVKAHTGANATAAADQLGAHAYATDDASIVFGEDNPSKELVAHEVVHTQQRGGGTEVEDEAEADALGNRLAAGERIDRAEVKSGGGKVRKKAKGAKEAKERPLVEVFEDFVIDKLVSIDDLEVPEVVPDLTPGFTRKDTVTPTVALGFGSFSISEEATTRFGHQWDLRQAMTNAESQLNTAIITNHLESASLHVKTRNLEVEIDALDTLDPTLVVGKRVALQDQIAATQRRITVIASDLELQKQTIARIERVQDELMATDPELSADTLAMIESSFQESSSRTAKRSFGFNLLKAEIERSHSETLKSGGKTATSSTQEKLSISGGAAYDRTKTTRFEHADGKATESTSSLNAKAIAKEDGTVGLGGGGKLGSSLEQTYGKVSTATSFDGAVTVNLLEVPKARPTDPQLYAVVMTLGLGAALEYKLGRESKINPAQADRKRKAALTAGASVGGEITQTHMLTTEQARQYLIDLEQAGQGDPQAASKKAEFTLVHKALAAGTSMDDLAGGVVQALGGSAAARSMPIGDSTEMTLKAGGSLELGGDMEGGVDEDAKKIGGSLGGKADAFRTLKIARVDPDQPGQELLEVTVAFGSTKDMHGSLTASTLGVTMTAGGKLWSGNEAAVTFRLDASQPSYDQLYDQILGTASLEQLVRLRKSTQFAEHVLAYTDKKSHGAGVDVRAEGPLSVGVSKSTERSSSHGKTKDGGLTREEVGASTDAVSFGVGALDLLKRSQTDTATFSLQDGVAMVDAMEQTDSAHLGQFSLPGLHGLMAAESPTKALEKAVLKTTKQLDGYFLDPEDLARLALRARDPAWHSVPDVVNPLSRGNHEAWTELGAELISPTLDPEFPLEQIELARVVARGTAIAEFMPRADHGKGVEHLHVALRENQRAGGDGTDFGVKYEFPAGLDKAKYVDLRRKCKGTEIKLGQLISNGEAGLDAGMAYVGELHYEIALMLATVEANPSFVSERSRVEMIGELRGFVTLTANARRDFMRRISGDEITDELEAKDEVTEAESRARQLERTLAESKVSENRLLGRARILRAEDSGSSLVESLEPIVGDLEQLYEHHAALERSLRASYRAAGVPKTDWKVRAYSHDDLRDYDVDIDEALEVLAASRHHFANIENRRTKWIHDFHLIKGE